MGNQKIMMIQGSKVLQTGTGGIFVNGVRINIVVISKKYYRQDFKYKDQHYGFGKVRKNKVIINIEIIKLRGLSLEEALIKLNIIKSSP